MTNKEAIETIEANRPRAGYHDLCEALEMAMKALEQEPFINKTCVSEKVCEHDKQKILDKIRAEIEELRYGQPFRKFVVDECLEIIDKYKEESEVQE